MTRLPLACEQGDGKEAKKGKREPVRMAKDFDFEMLTIDVIFKLTIWVTGTTTTNNSE